MCQSRGRNNLLYNIPKMVRNVQFNPELAPIVCWSDSTGKGRKRLRANTIHKPQAPQNQL